MTKVIGLTGGIGSGKTMIANYIKSLGIPVYIADDEAKEIMKSEEVIQKIVTEFGDDIFVDGKLSREKLSELVFSSEDKLKKLNGIVHPKVKEHFDNWLQAHGDVPFVVKEAAILFESGSYKYCDAVITITSPVETRIQRVIARDKTDYESVIKRIGNQWTDEQKIAKSDYIINNISIDETKKRVNEILKLLKNK